MGKKAKFVPREESSEEEEEDFMDDEDDVMMSEDGSEEEAEEDEGEEQEGDGQAAPAARKKKGSQRPDREPIYDVDGLHEKLEDIGWADEVAWEETQAISHTDPAQIENVDDDIARELAFYNQALSAAQQAIVKFESAGTAWLRPQDYYAEMVKTDSHMAKVKEQLMHEQQSIEQAEERRKAREAKQYSKMVQAEKQKERTAAKKKSIEEVSKLRKQREKSGFAGDMDFDAELERMERGPARNQGKFKDRGGPPGANASNKKRQARNAKYGFGGPKRASKQNDAYSAAAVDYKPNRSKDFGGGKQGGGKGKPGGVKKTNMKRPGKNARAAKKGKR